MIIYSSEFNNIRHIVLLAPKEISRERTLKILDLGGEKIHT
jgi:hypothetical protein